MKVNTTVYAALASSVSDAEFNMYSNSRLIRLKGASGESMDLFLATSKAFKFVSPFPSVEKPDVRYNSAHCHKA